jgi:phospholipase C
VNREQRRRFDRRTILQAGLGTAALAALPLAAAATSGAAAARSAGTPRPPDSLPFPAMPVGEDTGAFPFDHIVIAMMENHSFDNYLGLLPLRGQPKADGFRFNRKGQPVNGNPLGGQWMPSYHQTSECHSQDTGSQSWDDTHLQIDGGRMDGFARTGPGSMGYWTDEDLPFYYSLAKTFTLANRWFCSAPCQTYPNRRFLMAGTASGIISTDISNVTTNPPPNGTIWDRLSQFNISWRNYFSDAPSTAIIFETVEKYPEHIGRIEEFYLDCAAGTLPSVSLVDPDYGSVTGEVGGVISPFPVPLFSTAGTVLDVTGQSEENPEDVQLGEAFMAGVVNAVMAGPAWPRTLLIWLYDEHGGYYDHVPPPAAILPDNTPPILSSTNQPGAYGMYGPRVPAVVVSPYARANEVTNVVHDHTSVLSTIETKWNLPALTYRDANARTLADFLDLSTMSFPEPPALAAPANPQAGLLSCYENGQPQPPPPLPSKPH